jgi:hypothetical protein
MLKLRALAFAFAAATLAAGNELQISRMLDKAVMEEYVPSRRTDRTR